MPTVPRAHHFGDWVRACDERSWPGRDDIPHGQAARIRREVLEIVAVVPTLSDDFTVEPIFTRPALGRPLEWTGALPARLEQRVDRSLPNDWRLRGILEGRNGPL